LLEEARSKRERGWRIGMVLTVVIITHAKDMRAFADNVAVLEAGKVVEEGGFEELFSRGRVGGCGICSGLG
jgi:ABC-type multidrug transport system fused ATPase/permease subunit